MMCWWRTDKNPMLQTKNTKQRMKKQQREHIERERKKSLESMSKWILRIQSSLWQTQCEFDSVRDSHVNARTEPKAKRSMQIIIAISYLCHSLFDKHHFRSMYSFIIFLRFVTRCRLRSTRYHMYVRVCLCVCVLFFFTFALAYSRISIHLRFCRYVPFLFGSRVVEMFKTERHNEMAEGILTSQKEF